MKKILLTAFMIISALISIHAETHIYIFVKSLYNTDIKVSINGTELCDLNGAVCQTNNLKLGTMVKHKSCYRDIIVNGEGKFVITGTLLYKVPTTGNVNPYKGEISLDIADGETYYLQLTSKGLHDAQIKEIKAKNAKKWIQEWQNLGNINYSL